LAQLQGGGSYLDVLTLFAWLLSACDE